MTDHLTDEQIMQLIYGEGADDCRKHLQSCSQCSERYGESKSALDMVNCIKVPEISPSEHTSMFDAAWRPSGLAQKKHSSGLVWSMVRHGLSFGVGLACGMALLAITMAQSNSSNSISVEDYNKYKLPVPTVLQGTTAGKVFSELENPVIVVRDLEDQETKKEEELETQKKEHPQTIRRSAIEGTTENGSIQIVWNL